jgi:nitrogen fixation NifU-like protein
MEFDTMYMENILDHYKNPHNKGRLENPDIENEEKNPSCGDQIRVAVQLGKNKEITNIKFDGHGCAISQAAISMVSEDVKGKTIEKIMILKKEDVLGLLGIDIVPLRIKCAMLGLRVLQRGILRYEGKKESEILLSETEE